MRGRDSCKRVSSPAPPPPETFSGAPIYQKKPQKNANFFEGHAPKTAEDSFPSGLCSRFEDFSPAKRGIVTVD
ncbi:hypothetical protein DWUX_1976 [Desulfovibrio diazotrophicus]|nr:hypothetical protein DWUX_1976 [Desulfovibrio diazotrophicus]